MKKSKVLVIILLSVEILFSLSSCGMEKSTKKFCVEIVDDYEEKEYITSKELDFARVGDVTIIPEVKEINHGEYAVYIAAYSKTGSKQVTVKNVSLREGENIFFTQETEQSISYQQDSENTYGWVNIGSFTEEDMEFSNGKLLCLTVQVQVENESQNLEKEIAYEIELIQYWRHVMET